MALSQGKRPLFETLNVKAVSLTPDDSDNAVNILTATQIHRFTKIDNTIGWMGQGFTAIGAVATAVVPD